MDVAFPSQQAAAKLCGVCQVFSLGKDSLWLGKAVQYPILLQRRLCCHEEKTIEGLRRGKCCPHRRACMPAPIYYIYIYIYAATNMSALGAYQRSFRCSRGGPRPCARVMHVRVRGRMHAATPQLERSSGVKYSFLRGAHGARSHHPIDRMR